MRQLLARIDARGEHQVDQVDLLRELKQRHFIRDHIAEVFHALRRVSNRAVHHFSCSRQEALDALHLAYKLACCFFSDSPVFLSACTTADRLMEIFLCEAQASFSCSTVKSARPCSTKA